MEPTQGWCAPAAALRPWVEGYWYVRAEAGGPRECVLPDGASEIVLNLADPFRRLRADGAVETQPRALVAGQIDRALELEASGRVELVGIRFRPHGAHRFLRMPADELLNLTPALADAAPELESALVRAVESRAGDRRASTRASESSEDAPAFSPCARALDAALLAALDARERGRDRSDPRVAEAVRRIVASRGALRVDALARDLGVGVRQLERLFLREVGLGPKRLARIQRFQALLQASGRHAHWAELAAELGFSDQAHLVREFKAFAGVTPGRWCESEHALSDFFTRAGELDAPRSGIAS